MNPPEGVRSAQPPNSRRVFGPFTLDVLRCELLRDGRTVALRPKAFDLLAFLTSRPGEVLTKDQLIATVWAGVVVTDDSLTQCVHELRGALGDAGSLLKTVPRRGYRFDAVVESGSAPTPGAAPPEAARPVPADPVEAPALLAARGRRRLELLAGAGLLVAVLTLALLAWNPWRGKPAASPAPALSIVLLPLESLDEATSTGFADALTADLNAELGRLASVFVI